MDRYATVFEISLYEWDGVHSYNDSVSLHMTYEGAKKKLSELHTEDSFEVHHDSDTGWPELFIRNSQFGYMKYFIQARELED